MNLLNKINDVTINNTNRISETDKKYCENQFKQYSKAQDALWYALTRIKETYEQQQVNEGKSFLCKYDDIRPMEERISKVKRDFIRNITQHFSRQYSVTVDSESIDQKYNTYLTHDDVISEIFEQLGGCSFEEKAVSEIIEASKNTIYNFNERVTIKKSLLSITNYVSWNSFWETYKLHWDSKLGTLFKALSHFENGSTETLYLLNQMLQHLESGAKEYDIFSKYEFEVFNKIKSIKVFKNSKINIEFYSNEQATEFANTYLKK
ncbi:hypothetical protein P4U97_01260 [Bacillus swezeyi]|uniref:hypothetical protein n=1 Tax=Bacillus swezeyi TaxID=1925020 RepID=UPI002E220C43|nr:hypothetical protein [Bacillus swezeyi]